MSKYLPHGTSISIGSVDIGGLVSVSLPDRSRGEAETTDTDSDFDRAYIPGLRETGQVAITVRHDPDDAGQIALETNYNAGQVAAVEEFVITLPDAASLATGSQTYTFDGFVSAPLAGDLPLTDDTAAEQTATIKITGPVQIS